MKNIFTALAMSATAALAAHAQSATTTPVGYEGIRLLPNQLNVIGLRLHAPSMSKGWLSKVNVNTPDPADDTVEFIPQRDYKNPSSGVTYVLEITSGAATNLTLEAQPHADGVLTVPGIATAGLTGTESYNLRPALTLEGIFGTTHSVLTKGANAAEADVVWVPNGTGGHDRYFLHGADSTWRAVSDGSLATNVPVFYTDGILVEKRGTPAFLQSTGEITPKKSSAYIREGLNFVSTIYPVGATLQNFGLDDDVKQGANSSEADLVWIPDGKGGYKRYFLNNEDHAWHEATGSVASADLTLTPGILIERKAPAKLFTFTPPTSYSGL